MIINSDIRNDFKYLETCVTKGPRAFDTAGERAEFLATVWQKNRERYLPALNAGANTISTDLKRNFVMAETVRAFSKRIVPLKAFASRFVDVPLLGTDKISIASYPLQTAASSNFVAGTGYEFAGSTTINSVEITVDKRKYIPLDYSSEEFRRQPFFDVARLGAINAEKLAYDVVCDVLSIVTAANYGLAAKTVSASAIASDDIGDVKGECNRAHWPDQGRSLIVDSTVDDQLQKDDSYKLAMNSGSNTVLINGQLPPKISGFDYYWMPDFPTNSENLIGIAVFYAAILCAFCPVKPGAGVMAQLAAYDLAIDPVTGIAMNYRKWGDCMLDRTKEVIECSYGYQAGLATAIKRICSPA